MLIEVVAVELSNSMADDPSAVLHHKELKCTMGVLEYGGRRGGRGVAGRYPLHSSLRDERPQRGVGVHSPSQLQLIHLLHHYFTKLIKDAFLQSVSDLSLCNQ